MALLLQATYRHRQRTRLMQLLLLAMRCLFFIGVGLALAQPIIGEASSSLHLRTVHLLLDDSVVTGLRDSDGTTAFERHVQSITNLLDSTLHLNTAITLTLTAEPVLRVVDEPSTDHHAIKTLLATLEPRDSGSAIAEAVKRIGGASGVSMGHNEIRLYSDFRAGSIQQNEPPQALPTTTTGSIEVWATPPATIEVGDVRINKVFIDRNPASTTQSGLQARRVTVKLFRTGILPAYQHQVWLEGSGINNVAPRTVEWSEGREQATIEFHVQLLDKGGEVHARIGHDDLVTGDSSIVIITDPGPLQIVLASRTSVFESGGGRLDTLGAGDWLLRALNPLRTSNTLSSTLIIDRVDPISMTPNDIAMAKVIFLTDPSRLTETITASLLVFVRDGGVLVVMPPETNSPQAWASPLFDAFGLPWLMGLEPIVFSEPRKLAAEQPTSSLLSFIESELPTLAPSVVLEKAIQVGGYEAGNVVLLDEKNDAVLLDVQVGFGRFILFTTSPTITWTNLPVRPLMVPLVHEIVRRGSDLSQRDTNGIAGQYGPRLGNRTATRLIGPTGERFSIQGTTIDPLPSRSGMYDAVDLGDRIVDTLVVDPNTNAINVGVVGSTALLEWLGAINPKIVGSEPIQNETTSTSTNADLAYKLLLLAAALLLGETLLARLSSRARMAPIQHTSPTSGAQ